MNKIYNPTPESWSAILERPTKTIDDIELTVKEIFKEVQKKGDEAIAKYTSLFDGVTIDNQKFLKLK
jgi:histidinol dehydrogenase